MSNKTLPVIVVLGNMKGGVGKSTLALHFALQCLHEGYRVTCLDVDGLQGTLARSIANRQAYCKKNQLTLPIPEVLRFYPNTHPDPLAAGQALEELIQSQSHQEIIVMDTQGSDTPSSRYAHGRADVLITPITESPLDLDLLVDVGASQEQGSGALPLGSYAEIVWKERLTKAAKSAGALEWVVVRNRLSPQVSPQRLKVDEILKKLAPRIGFHLCPGLGDRPIFRELFGYGLTVLDRHTSATMAQVTAKQEIRAITHYVLDLLKKNTALSSPQKNHADGAIS